MINGPNECDAIEVVFGEARDALNLDTDGLGGKEDREASRGTV